MVEMRLYFSFLLFQSVHDYDKYFAKRNYITTNNGKDGQFTHENVFYFTNCRRRFKYTTDYKLRRAIIRTNEYRDVIYYLYG